jgi:phosphoribosyl 1,2-cyclic phosphodiesterase
MITFSLQSGSNGNAIYVEAGDVRLIFDAGISGRLAETRMASKGRDIRDCDAVVISHDHSDHTQCAGIFQRKFGLPVYMTERVYRAVRHFMGPISDIRHFAPNDRLEFGSVAVQTLHTPHDGIDSVCFVVEHDGKKLGVFTDLGHPFDALGDTLADIDAAYLEGNYDPEMLQNGSYPETLKRRIAGLRGHLSNDEAAALVSRRAGGKLKWLAIAHLSEENNTPDLAIATHRRILGTTLPVHVAPRDGTSVLLEV